MLSRNRVESSRSKQISKPFERHPSMEARRSSFEAPNLLRQGSSGELQEKETGYVASEKKTLSEKASALWKWFVGDAGEKKNKAIEEAPNMLNLAFKAGDLARWLRTSDTSVGDEVIDDLIRQVNVVDAWIRAYKAPLSWTRDDDTVISGGYSKARDAWQGYKENRTTGYDTSMEVIGSKQEKDENKMKRDVVLQADSYMYIGAKTIWRLLHPSADESEWKYPANNGRFDETYPPPTDANYRPFTY